MATIKHIFKGESLSMLFAFPADYDMARIEKHGIWIGGTEFTGVIIGQGIELKLTSLQTDLMSGNQRVSLWIDDSQLGVRKPYVGDIAVGNTNALPDNESTSEVYDVIVNVDISETAIEVDGLMFDFMKGASAYQVWLDAGNTGTVEDFLEWIQSPANEVIASVQEVENIALYNETLRATAEGLRVTAESTRQTNETTRQDSEDDREDAEALRLSAEITRGQNEQSRVNAEGLRGYAEGTRQTNTATAITNANTAATNANTKAGLANDAANNANTKATLANDAAILANEKAGLANTAATNADNARLAIHGDLALKADQADLAQLESDVEQLAYVKIKNEAVNGNFENGLIAPFSRVDGGGGTSTLAINSSTPISGNYDIRLTIITPTTTDGRPIFYGLNKAGNIGDKIYLHFYAKILSGTPRINSIHTGGSGGSLIYGGNVINGRNTRIIDVVGTNNLLGLIYFNSMSVWDMQMDNFMRINLTETFGAGNEPTKEEMDLLISTLGIDYFEGEITIPAQKIMQWQLKLIRKNKNAIIALGGTII